MLRASYDIPLPRLLSMYELTLEDVRAYEPTWRQQARYDGPPLV